jgi:hypothetical protein
MTKKNTLAAATLLPCEHPLADRSACNHQCIGYCTQCDLNLCTDHIGDHVAPHATIQSSFRINILADDSRVGSIIVP